MSFDSTPLSVYEMIDFLEDVKEKSDNKILTISDKEIVAYQVSAFIVINEIKRLQLSLWYDLWNPRLIREYLLLVMFFTFLFCPATITIGIALSWFIFRFHGWRQRQVERKQFLNKWILQQNAIPVLIQGRVPFELFIEQLQQSSIQTTKSCQEIIDRWADILQDDDLKSNSNE